MRKVLAGVSFVLLWCGGPVSDVSAEQDQTVNDFLAACAKKSDAWSDCSFTVSTIDLYDDFNPHGTHTTCPPRSSPEVETTSVVNWLNAHPETHNLMQSAGILAALRALYPCQRRVP
jgi:Rap1a immunity proteins